MREARARASRGVREGTTAGNYSFPKERRSSGAGRCAEGLGIVLLDADVAAVFPDPASVNEALRALMRTAERLARRRRLRA